MEKEEEEGSQAELGGGIIQKVSWQWRRDQSRASGTDAEAMFSRVSTPTSQDEGCFRVGLGGGGGRWGLISLFPPVWVHWQPLSLSTCVCGCSSQNMMMSFRVSDLQMLLGFVGRSKSGLKHELVTRALQLVQFDCSPELFKKIKELYETRYAKKSSEPVPQPHRPLDPLTMHSTYDRAGTVPRTPLTGPNIDYPVLYGKYLNGLGRLPAKTLKPEVRLVKLPFFNMLDELLKPTELGESTAFPGGPTFQVLLLPMAGHATDPEHFRGAATSQRWRRSYPSQKPQGPPMGL